MGQLIIGNGRNEHDSSLPPSPAAEAMAPARSVGCMLRHHCGHQPTLIGHIDLLLPAQEPRLQAFLFSDTSSHRLNQDWHLLVQKYI